MLKSAITTRMKALLKRTDALRTIQESEQVAPVHGLTQPELAVLAAVAGSVVVPSEGVGIYAVKRDVERAGFTALGFSLGLRRLREKNFVELRDSLDNFGQEYQDVLMGPAGWDWIERNQDKFILQRPEAEARDDDEFRFSSPNWPNQSLQSTASRRTIEFSHD